MGRGGHRLRERAAAVVARGGGRSRVVQKAAGTAMIGSSAALTSFQRTARTLCFSFPPMPSVYKSLMGDQDSYSYYTLQYRLQYGFSHIDQID